MKGLMKANGTLLFGPVIDDGKEFGEGVQDEVS